jgi:hypothetical protein
MYSPRPVLLSAGAPERQASADCRIGRSGSAASARRSQSVCTIARANARGRGSRARVATDAVFSMDGDIAPLDAIGRSAAATTAGCWPTTPMGWGCSATTLVRRSASRRLGSTSRWGPFSRRCAATATRLRDEAGDRAAVDEPLIKALSWSPPPRLRTHVRFDVTAEIHAARSKARAELGFAQSGSRTWARYICDWIDWQDLSVTPNTGPPWY